MGVYLLREGVDRIYLAETGGNGVWEFEEWEWEWDSFCGEFLMSHVQERVYIPWAEPNGCKGQQNF